MFITANTDNIVSKPDFTRHPADLLDRFTLAPAANVGDVFDRLKVVDSNIRCLTGNTRLVGTALPILTRAGDNLAIHRALDDAQPGDVLVINGQADLSRALIGDLIGEIMVSRGVVGAVVDGVIRDAETLSRQGLAVFARGTTPAGPFKNGPGIIGDPVAVGGVVISAGDIIVADADGIAIVPRDQAHTAVDLVHQVIATEEDLRRRILAAAGAR
jgi:regulator of RNase E activity RraA